MHRGRHFFNLLCCLGTMIACLGLTGRAAAQTTGACCVRDASGTVTCSVLTRAGCYNAHGLYRGDNTTCDNNPCTPPATGSCCLSGGFCIVTTAADCSSRHGTYNGDNTTCAAAN